MKIEFVQMTFFSAARTTRRTKRSAKKSMYNLMWKWSKYYVFAKKGA